MVEYGRIDLVNFRNVVHRVIFHARLTYPYGGTRRIVPFGNMGERGLGPLLPGSGRVRLVLVQQKNRGRNQETALPLPAGPPQRSRPNKTSSALVQRFVQSCRLARNVGDLSHVSLLAPAIAGIQDLLQENTAWLS